MGTRGLKANPGGLTYFCAQGLYIFNLRKNVLCFTRAFRDTPIFTQHLSINQEVMDYTDSHSMSLSAVIGVVTNFENMPASFGVGKIFMIRRHLRPEERICLHADKIFYIVKENLDKSVVVSHIGELGVKQLGHLVPGGAEIVCL